MIRAVLVSLVVTCASAAAAQNSLQDGLSMFGQVSGSGVPTEMLEAAPGRLMAGLRFPAAGFPMCGLDLMHRAPNDAGMQAARFSDCAMPGEVDQKTITVSDGQAVIGLRVCLDADETGLEAVALRTVPAFCAADPTLYVERDTGLPFRARTRTETGFLRPPWQYARPCTSSVVIQTASDARPGCKRWQGLSQCPEGFVVTGLGLATADGPGGTVITGLQARCKLLETEY